MPLDRQLIDRLTAGDRAALAEVRAHLEQAQHAWSRIDSGAQCELNASHHDEGALAGCLYRGLRAVEELIEWIDEPCVARCNGGNAGRNAS